MLILFFIFYSFFFFALFSGYFYFCIVLLLNCKGINCISIYFILSCFSTVKAKLIPLALMPLLKVKRTHASTKLKPPVKRRKVSKKASCVAVCSQINDPEKGTGSGRPGDPYRLPLRKEPNLSGCLHCPTLTCPCQQMESLLAEVFNKATKKRVTEVAGYRHLCAKSLLPPFVTRLIRILNIRKEDTFYDLGCGNGSILFQVACITGAKCIGVEISKHNAELAIEASSILKSEVKRFQLPDPEITIICGDIGEFLSNHPQFEEQKGKTVILISNLLFPKSLTHFMSERFRSLPSGTRIICFDDLYPHGRSVAAIRDPEAFRLFEMTDYLWQEYSVEWCWMEGSFYVHRKR